MTWQPGGHNNWFSVSVSEPRFRLKFNQQASVLYHNFEDAADSAASLLYQQWGDRPLYLALSGGVDSEFTAKIFLKNNIPFTPVILKINDINHYETWYAEYWCYVNDVKPIVLEMSIEEYVKELARLSVKLGQIKNFYMATPLLLYEHASELGGSSVFCGGDINLDSDTKQFYCRSLDFASNLVDVGNHPTSFFMYTAELALSYVNQFDMSQTEQYNKLSFYGVAPRPKLDYIPLLNGNNHYHYMLDKISRVLNLDPFDTDSQKHWYGSQEQLIKDLHP